MLHKFYKILLILGIAAVLVAVPAFWFAYSASNDLEVDFLDVGQGDSILIKMPYGQNILIDGGPDNAAVKQLSENLPWWDRTIDLMILTHPHDDHVNGLNDVIKRYNIKKILYTGVSHTSPSYLAWLDLIRDYHIPLIIIDRPQVINFGEDCWLEILYPLNSLLGKEADNLNNSSIVARLIYDEVKFLFTGDIEIETEQDLLAAYSKEAYSSSSLQAQVLKVGHHGSNTSSSQEFLEAINPEIAVIQVGADNKFGHPSRRTIKRLERLGAGIFRNDIDGTVIITSNGRELQVVSDF
ncbi:MAG: ComEC/Rec2 family competence protein [Patescibacteria group bacterium]|nr:ComEC/Rec2 family competence protein [Patescibacteria group bacterium]